MRRSATRIDQKSVSRRRNGTCSTPAPIIRIANGTFYRRHPDAPGAATSSNPPLFPNLTFALPSFASKPEHWSVIGPSSSGKTTFLQILRGGHLCVPPTGRSYPYLRTPEIASKDHRLRNPSAAIGQVGFDGEQGLGQPALQSAYLSARYESRREDTDVSLLDYLHGHTEPNPSDDGKKVDTALLERVVRDLRLQDLTDIPVANLSNGQTRRARIARALLGDPEVLLLDEPFMGLDPPTLLSLSPLLHGLAEANRPRLVLSLRPQDPIPDWITHLVYLKDSCEVAFQGLKSDVQGELKELAKRMQGRTNVDADAPLHSMHEVGRSLTKDGIVDILHPDSGRCKDAFGANAASPRLSRDGFPLDDVAEPVIGEPLIQMEGVRVRYGSKIVLGNWEQAAPNGRHITPRTGGLWWDVRRGERWGIFGPNGSGKTTLLSLVSSDHPQTYALPIRLFGNSRIPEPGQRGISIFDLQARIGHSSPEIHSRIPKSLTVRQVLENAWADTFRGVPQLDETAKAKTDACLGWFERDLRTDSSPPREENSTEWADRLLFGGLPFSSQRVALFLRAIIKSPDLVILDEAFSGMDDGLRDRCLLFLAHGETKQFSAPSPDDSETYPGNQRPAIVESEAAKLQQVKVAGMSRDQALLCISHVREEIPGSIREWICLPEANTGKPARFGRLDGPIEGDYRRWSEIWGV